MAVGRHGAWLTPAFGIMALLLGGCAAQNGATPPGMTAISSPPVRLGGTGSMIFLPAPSPLPPPPAVFGDYNPGPWAIFYALGTGRPLDGTRDALTQIAHMAARLPAIGVSLCPVSAIASVEPVGVVQRRMKALRTQLRRLGVKRIVTGSDIACSGLERRELPMIRVAPNIGPE